MHKREDFFLVGRSLRPILSLLPGFFNLIYSFSIFYTMQSDYLDRQDAQQIAKIKAKNPKKGGFVTISGEWPDVFHEVLEVWDGWILCVRDEREQTTFHEPFWNLTNYVDELPENARIIERKQT